MPAYSYKEVCYYQLPKEYVDKFEERHGREFDYDANYDGDYWIVVSDYIDDLQKEIEQLKKESK